MPESVTSDRAICVKSASTTGSGSVTRMVQPDGSVMRNPTKMGAEENLADHTGAANEPERLLNALHGS